MPFEVKQVLLIVVTKHTMLYADAGGLVNHWAER
jgi:hypothetical protein